MNRILSYVVVALIALAVGAFASSKYFDNREPEIIVKTETDTVTVVRVDSIPFTVIDERVKIKTVVLDLPDKDPVTGGDIVRQIQTQRYTGKEELENGTIDYTIYADSLHAVQFTLKTEDQIINNTTTITKTLPPKSALFAGGGLNYNQGISSAEVGLMYNRRQKWQAGIVVNHDLTGLLPKGAQTSIGVRAYIKL